MLHCRVPARRPGNFHLRGQMKVTKAKALNAKPFGSFFALRKVGPAGHLEPPLRLEVPAHSTGPRFALAVGPARGRGIAKPARPSEQVVGRAALVQVPRWAGRPQRAERVRGCIEPLCFGDFYLGPQMKVTRPPGRDPAMQRSSLNQSTMHVNLP